MSRSTASLVLALVLALPTAALAQDGKPTPTPPGPPGAVCLDFEAPLVLGTVYGRPVGQLPGDLAFVSQNVSVTVEAFRRPSAGFAFEHAQIVNPPRSFASGQSLRSNNIGLQFDFRAIGFTPKRVTLQFLDLGGYENLAVNGLPVPVYVGELAGAPSPIGGVAVAVTTVPLLPPISGKTGTLELTGPVSTLRIGGQELWIDSVCAYP
ncbi:MAG TPA: hypothetical protein VFS60_14675 [Thermoanaerobaculia bacterium]|nr:hypothetical protein [Thermoanaerobaculia bacterium]